MPTASLTHLRIIKMNKVAVTGSNGFIGSRLVRLLESKSYKVNKLCRTRSSKDPLSSKYFDLEGTTNFDYLKNENVLVHCAYDFSPKSIKDKKRVNIDCTLHLFSEAKRLGVKKIILISSNASFKNAASDYGKIKYELEQKAKNYNVIVIRPGLIFGSNFSGIMGSLEKLVLFFRFLPIVGSGKQQFYPCHIEDLISLIAKVIECDQEYDRPIVAASEQAVSLREILSTLAKYHALKRTLIPIPSLVIILCLRLAEFFKLPVGFKFDSLKTMMVRNETVDFTATKQTNINFREFSMSTCDEKSD